MTDIDFLEISNCQVLEYLDDATNTECEPFEQVAKPGTNANFIDKQSLKLRDFLERNPLL